VLLRIDDLDRARFRMEYLDDIFFTLDWLGIDYDEGPASSQDFLDRFSQSRRTDLYHEALRQLAELGTCCMPATARGNASGSNRRMDGTPAFVETGNCRLTRPIPPGA
jgi:glutamyl/glutaminyl-tRNA synthetase